MRITERQRKIIKEAVREVCSEASVRLFGSRVNDNARGGDIDLFIAIPVSCDTPVNSSKFSIAIQKKFGEEMPLDVVVYHEGDDLKKIHHEGIQGVLL